MRLANVKHKEGPVSRRGAPLVGTYRDVCPLMRKNT